MREEAAARAACVPTNGLTPLEVATHVVMGIDEDAAKELEDQPETTPIAALEQTLLELLLRPPCVVSFSGGRDSSILLGLAVRVARREGLEEPIAATMRFPAVDQASEDEWQGLVISSLRLANWERMSFTNELDLVGPVAQQVMLRDGLPYPYNLHLQTPLLRIARGGALVTGLGGDEVFSPADRIWAVLRGRSRPHRSDLVRVARALSPAPVRRRIRRQSVQLSMPWLRPEANRELSAAWFDDVTRIPLRWNRSTKHWRAARYVKLTIERLSGLAASEGVEIRHPFAEPAFVAGVAREFGAFGFDTRAGALARLFGDVIPPETVTRTTKASFDDVLWSDSARHFAADLRGRRLGDALDRLGVGEVVDATALEAHWRADDRRRANSFLLLQGCWLSLNG